jgi:hypothetical protein
VSNTLSEPLDAGGVDRLEEFRKHALTSENRVKGNEMTLW